MTSPLPPKVFIRKIKCNNYTKGIWLKNADFLSSRTPVTANFACRCAYFAVCKIKRRLHIAA